MPDEDNGEEKRPSPLYRNRYKVFAFLSVTGFAAILGHLISQEIVVVPEWVVNPVFLGTIGAFTLASTGAYFGMKVKRKMGGAGFTPAEQRFHELTEAEAMEVIRYKLYRDHGVFVGRKLKWGDEHVGEDEDAVSVYEYRFRPRHGVGKMAAILSMKQEVKPDLDAFREGRHEEMREIIDGIKRFSVVLSNEETNFEDEIERKKEAIAKKQRQEVTVVETDPYGNETRRVTARGTDAADAIQKKRVRIEDGSGPQIPEGEKG